MTRRQAKKVLRDNPYNQRGNRGSTWRAAWRIVNRIRDSSAMTAGWRWGRWDPREPRPPWEMPF